MAVALLIPTIRSSRQSDSERAAREHRAEQARLARALQEEQRPVLDSTKPLDGIAGRGRMLDAIAAAILADARERVRTGALNGPIRRVHCQPFPNGSDPADRDLSRRRGRYSCLAVTATFEGGLIGHQYRVAADFQSGRYGFCKITGRAGPERDRPVTIPAACGGDAYGGG